MSAHVLGVGIATLDVINTVDHYPQEDEEMRALSQQRCRGGNVTNTLTVLARLGYRCSWAGTLADDADAAVIRQELELAGIDFSDCPVEPDSCSPVSWVIRNRQNGSRTIIHHRHLPELSFEQFAAISLDQYQWVHFEGRHVSETARMIERVRQVSNARVSVEIEKERQEIERLFEHADLVLFSRAFANGRGFDSGAEFVRHMAARIPATEIVCAWGAEGAFGIDRQGQVFESPAFPPDKLIDTLAAGDVFNAGIIAAMQQGLSLGNSLKKGCRLAGRKCGIQGLAV
jgi:ketohexokinase